MNPGQDYPPWVELDDSAILQEFVQIGVLPAEGLDGRMTRVGPNVTIRSHSVVYAGVDLGAGVHLGHGVLVREDSVVGPRSSVGSHSVLELKVRIGSDVRIHSNAFIPEYSIVEDGAWIGPSVCLTNARYPVARDTKNKLEGVTVRERAIVGAGAVILPGVVIGQGAFVGAGSVVTRDVPAGTVVVGNPARKIRMVSEIEDYQ